MGVRGVIVGVLVTAAAGGAGLVITSGGSGLPALASPSCVAGATNVTTASAVQSNVAAGRDVCVAVSVGDVSLTNLTDSTVEHIGTTGSGFISSIDFDNTAYVEASVRADSLNIRGGSDHVTVQSSKLGGNSATDRTSSQVVRMLDNLAGTSNVTIQDTEIGWTSADTSGNTGYGIRANSTDSNLIIRRNWIHDLASDGIQGVGGTNVLIDRNEIGPVGQSPGSSEHSDIIQLTGNDVGMQITNNYFHDEGYFDSGSGYVQNGTSGIIYVHGGSTGSLLLDNNLFKHGVGQMETCGLGTGGNSRSNITISHNTYYDLAIGGPGINAFRWDCDTGTGNTIQYNLDAHDPAKSSSGFAADGTSLVATWLSNISGDFTAATFDGDMNCTSGNCNPGGGVTIGYRKPSGVHW